MARTRTSSEAQRYVQTTLRYASAAIAVGRVRFYEMLSGEQALGERLGLNYARARRLVAWVSGLSEAVQGGVPRSSADLCG